METSHVSSSRWMEKQAVVPAHGGILYSLKGRATWVQGHRTLKPEDLMLGELKQSGKD